jgi:hypothetical protein
VDAAAQRGANPPGALVIWKDAMQTFLDSRAHARKKQTIGKAA